MSELSRELISNQKVIFWLSCIIGIGLIVRFFYFPNEVPIVTDGYFSFVYGIKTVFDGGLPIGLQVGNSGWANFLSFIFIFLEKSDPLQLMNAQRCASIVISTVTAVPIFFLLKRFVDIKLALFGSFLLVIEPRLLLISLEGINFSLFFFLFSLSIALFLKKTNISLIICFVVLAITVIVRYEALLMIIPFSVMYFIKFRERKHVLRFLVLIGLMGMILFSVGTIRIQATQDICYENEVFGETCGKDGIFSEILGNILFFTKYIILEEKLDYPEGDESYKVHEEEYSKSDQSILSSAFTLSISKLIRFLGLILIPYFVFFIAFNTITRIKNVKNIKWNFNLVTILFSSAIMLLPAMYGYVRDIDEIRYIMILIPLICIISVSFSESILQRFNNDKRILIILILFTMILSIGFIELEKRDYVYDRESFKISKEIVSLTDKSNLFEASGYVKTAVLFKEWPDLPKPNLSGKIDHSFQKISIKNFVEIDKFVIFAKKSNLEYFVVGENEILFEKLWNKTDMYPFLVKIFDSDDYDYENRFLIFKINFEKFNER